MDRESPARSRHIEVRAYVAAEIRQTEGARPSRVARRGKSSLSDHDGAIWACTCVRPRTDADAARPGTRVRRGRDPGDRPESEWRSAGHPRSPARLRVVTVHDL